MKRYKCPNCASANTVFAQRKQKFNCRACGEVFARKEAVIQVVSDEEPVKTEKAVKK